MVTKDTYLYFFERQAEPEFTCHAVAAGSAVDLCSLSSNLQVTVLQLLQLAMAFMTDELSPSFLLSFCLLLKNSNRI